MFNRNAFATITRGAAWAREWENNQVTEARKVTYGLALDENINNVIAGTMSPEEAYEFSKYKVSTFCQSSGRTKSGDRQSSSG